MPGSIAWIDIDAIRANIDVVRRRTPDEVKLLFVVKSDGYGHGLVEMARVGETAGVDYLGVVSVDEGAELRRHGIGLPILILAPILSTEVSRAIASKLTVSVADIPSAAQLATAAKDQGTCAPVHVKVDTGMGRFGVDPADVPALLRRLAQEPALRVEGIFTQLSSADSLSPAARAYTEMQIKTFANLVHSLAHQSLLPPLCHIGNSAGFIQYPRQVASAPFNMVRIGTLIYGYPEITAPWTNVIRRAARLTAPIVAIRTIGAGGVAGYNRSYQATGPRRVAIIAAGYGTGVPPQLAGHGSVWVQEKLAPIVGNVYLDHTMIDVTDIPSATVGDDVEIFGPHLPADRVAEWAGLRVCELLVPALTQARQRVYR